MNQNLTCTVPPPLTDVELAMYLDGEAELGVEQHVAQCAACRDAATGLARQQAELAARLYRSACPTPDELRDYQMGLLTRTDASNIGLHLARCPHCTHELFVLDEFLGDPLPTPTLREQIRRLVASLAPGLSTGALAGQRGAHEPLLVYTAEGLQIGIEIEENLETGMRSIKGLITSGDLDNLLVHLWRDGQLVATALVDSLLGDFQFTNVEPATYELIISAQQTKFRIPQVAL